MAHADCVQPAEWCKGLQVIAHTVMVCLQSCCHVHTHEISLQGMRRCTIQGDGLENLAKGWHKPVRASSMII